MKIRLLDYLHKEHFVEVPDNTQQITIKVVSGDMVMLSPVKYDTSNTREVNYNDGIFTLQKNQFSILESVDSSFDFICKMYDYEWE